MARPLKYIDQKQFESLCGLQCTKEEICGFLEVTDKTLENWCKRTYKKGFSEVFREKRGKGKISLRRAQFRLAERSAAMAIWLGKQYLDQKDFASELDEKEQQARIEQIKANTERIKATEGTEEDGVTIINDIS